MMRADQDLIELVAKIKDFETRAPSALRGPLPFQSPSEIELRALLRDASSVLRIHFGDRSDYERDLRKFDGQWGGVFGAPSPAVVSGVRTVIELALRQSLREQLHEAIEHKSANRLRSLFVDETRLGELRALPKGRWDLTRLIRYAEELNDAWEQGNFLSVSMLVRAIKDHVPPIFSQPNFAAVFNNSNKSIKGNLEHLENSLKHIADGSLHTHIRAAEVLPTETQVDFRRDLDVLLGEVVRTLKA